jgi:hypothetical protein
MGYDNVIGVIGVGYMLGVIERRIKQEYGFVYDVVYSDGTIYVSRRGIMILTVDWKMRVRMCASDDDISGLDMHMMEKVMAEIKKYGCDVDM